MNKLPVRALLQSIFVVCAFIGIFSSSVRAETSESALAVAIGRACSPACKECTEICVGNPSNLNSPLSCQSSGYQKCANGNCIRNGSSCSCSPGCNECTHECQNGRCVSRTPNKKLCPSGACVDAGSKCPEDCGCNDRCTQRCGATGQCEGTGMQYCPPGAPGGACVSDPAQCGDRCNPNCDVCTEKCEGGSCKSNGNKRCWTGACVRANDECPPDRDTRTPVPTRPAGTAKPGSNMTSPGGGVSTF